MQPTGIVHGNRIFTKPLDIANQLNTYVVNVGPNLTHKLNGDPTISPTQYINYSPSSSFVMSPLSELQPGGNGLLLQVVTLIANLDENKCYINIPNILIKWLQVL